MQKILYYIYYLKQQQIYGEKKRENIVNQLMIAIHIFNHQFYSLISSNDKAFEIII
ncbi:hypothetical protein pb186bvf_019929 [Paramecium bursaria]